MSVSTKKSTKPGLIVGSWLKPLTELSDSRCRSYCSQAPLPPVHLHTPSWPKWNGRVKSNSPNTYNNYAQDDLSESESIAGSEADPVIGCSVTMFASLNGTQSSYCYHKSCMGLIWKVVSWGWGLLMACAPVRHPAAYSCTSLTAPAASCADASVDTLHGSPLALDVPDSDCPHTYPRWVASHPQPPLNCTIDSAGRCVPVNLFLSRNRWMYRLVLWNGDVAGRAK